MPLIKSITLPNALKSSSCAIMLFFVASPTPPKGGEIEMLVYLMFSSSKFYLTLFAQFTLPSRFLPIIIARRCERVTYHVLD